jgi:hypothetical protein
MFLNSLPECTRVRASLTKLPDAAKRWLALDPGAGDATS